MSPQAWRVMLWVGLWVAIGGLYACYFGIKADMALMRSELAKQRADTVRVEALRKWIAEVNSFNTRMPEPTAELGGDR